MSNRNDILNRKEIRISLVITNSGNINGTVCQIMNYARTVDGVMDVIEEVPMLPMRKAA